MRKLIGIAMLVMSVLFFCTGCSNQRVEEQLELRMKGITLMENEEYQAALEKFQEALDLSLGKIGDTEMDICFYKAEAQYMLGDIDGALATYTAIIEYNESARAYFLRGNYSISFLVKNMLLDSG